ncbi:MAG: tetratricopeptide repeat protein, partial [bacterium]
LELRPDYTAHGRIAYLYALTEDFAGAIEWCGRLIADAPSPGLKGLGNVYQSFYDLWVSRYEDMDRSLTAARSVFERTGSTLGSSGTWWLQAWERYRQGNYDASRRCIAESGSIMAEKHLLDAWYRFETGVLLGLMEIRESQINDARARLEDLTAERVLIEEAYPDRTSMAKNDALLLEGEILLAEGRIDACIDVCKKLPVLEIPSMMSTDILFFNLPMERDVLGRAYTAKGALDEAIAEYERLTTYDASSVDRRLVFPLFHYRLGRLYERKGRMDEAAGEYRKFVSVLGPGAANVEQAADAEHRLALLSAAN